MSARSALSFPARLPYANTLQLTRRALHVSTLRSKTGESSDMGRITDLLRQFKDPSSPFHIPPGGRGPADPDEPHPSFLNPTAVPGGAPDGASATSAADRLSSSSNSTPSSSSAPNTGPRSASPFNLPFAGPLDTPALEEAAGAHPFLAPEHERERVYERSREDALRWFRKEGYDTRATFEQKVVWGDMDSFQHVNNVRFIRWIESARLEWGASFAGLLPDKTLVDWVTGKGMGIILKDVSMRYRFPVTYPDTVFISNKIHSINQERASFGLANAIWSLRENKLVATGDSTIVVYDYDHLRKGIMSDEVRQALESRVRT